MDTINVAHSAWTTAEQTMRQCGALGKECVVYFCGRRHGDTAASATAAYHPCHRGSAIGYEVPVVELLKLNSWLYANGLSVLIQTHTHPGSAFHSGIDDRWPTIETVGFLSLVVPDFARRGLFGLPGCYLAEYLGSGSWREVCPEEMSKRIRLEK